MVEDVLTAANIKSRPIRQLQPAQARLAPENLDPFSIPSPSEGRGFVGI